MSCKAPRRCVLALAMACVAPFAERSATAQAAPQDTTWVREHFSKTEVRIAMRDGVHLYTVVYAPRDSSRSYPILLNRTPYSVAPYGEGKYRAPLTTDALLRDGYILVFQDVRGRFMSEGKFVDMTPHRDVKRGPGDTDESSDTYDTVDWLVKHVPHNNGRVGQWGISYPGFYTAAGMIDAHPALKAASPQAPIVDWFTGDDFHRNGALWLPHFFNFIAVFGKPRPVPTTEWPSGYRAPTADGYDFFLHTMGPLRNANPRFLHDSIAFWNDVMAHPNYDAFWQARNLRPHIRGIKPAVLTVGGEFDAENIYGANQVFRAVEKQSPGTPNFFVYGPWFHGGWGRSEGDHLGNVAFGSATAAFYRDSIEAPFFRCYLHERCDVTLPKATVFETGSNAWRRYDAWPPKGATPASFRLESGGRLVVTRGVGDAAMRGGTPAASDGAEPGPTTPASANQRVEAPGHTASPRPRVPVSAGNYDEYVSDPAHPVPFINQVAIGMTREYMSDDQRFAAQRPDVLVYRGEPLAEDVTVVGPLSPVLWVSTSGTDSDWVVKLIDVYPDDTRDNPFTQPGEHMGGYQQLVRGEVMRGRFRNSFEKPEPFLPGRPTKVAWSMNDVSHTFLKGHRIMVQIQSSWFPLMDRNPQKFVPSIYQASESDFVKVTQRVYHTAEMPSRIEVLEMLTK